MKKTVVVNLEYMRPSVGGRSRSRSRSRSQSQPRTRSRTQSPPTTVNRIVTSAIEQSTLCDDYEFDEMLNIKGLLDSEAYRDYDDDDDDDNDNDDEYDDDDNDDDHDHDNDNDNDNDNDYDNDYDNDDGSANLYDIVNDNVYNIHDYFKYNDNNCSTSVTVNINRRGFVCFELSHVCYSTNSYCNGIRQWCENF